MRRRILGLVGNEPSAATVLGANFSAGFVAGSLAAAATCPLDVAKTRRQIEVILENKPHPDLFLLHSQLVTVPIETVQDLPHSTEHHRKEKKRNT